MTTRQKIKGVMLASFVLGAFGGVGAFGMNWYVQRGARSLMFEVEDPTVPRRKVAIVLGARVYADGSPSPSLRDRLYVAWRLYERDRVQKILITGDHGTRGYNEVEAMFRWLREKGVPREALYVDHAGLRTLDSMQRAAKIFEVEEAILCTQRFHLPRSLFLARDAGIDAVGVIADQRVYQARKVNRAREFGARVNAFLDVYVMGTEPKHWGDKIPIDGPSSASYDDSIFNSKI